MFNSQGNSQDLLELDCDDTEPSISTLLTCYSSFYQSYTSPSLLSLLFFSLYDLFLSSPSDKLHDYISLRKLLKMPDLLESETNELRHALVMAIFAGFENSEDVGEYIDMLERTIEGEAQTTRWQNKKEEAQE